MEEDKNQMNGNSGSQEQIVSRRQFISYLLGFSAIATLAGVLTPIIGYLWPPSQAAGGSSNPVGQGKVVPVNDKPAIVVNTLQGGLKAYSAICPHLSCIVEWDQERQFIHCPCHDGRFNALNGAVISGPPPAPLPPLVVTVEGDAIYLSDQG